MKPTSTQVLAECLKLAAEFPDFLYKMDDQVQGCSNNRGGDPRYPDNCGCIVGQAYKRLTGNALPDRQEYFGIGSLVRFDFITDTTTQVLDHLLYLQRLQDKGKTWGQAIILSEES